MPEPTRYKDIFKHLKARGVDVYAPAQAKGECKQPYTVIKEAGGAQHAALSTAQQLYDIMCYVPKDRYSQLDEYAGQIKGHMKGLEPMINPTHFTTSSFYDDTVKAHMISIQYYNYRKI